MTNSPSPRDKRNFEKTLKEARIGTLEAQYELALMYANGVGVAMDIAKAIHWLQQAATKGLAAAQFLLATRYLNGIGVERDETAALLWLGRAVAQGHAKAQLRLGRFLETPHREAALACMQQAAQTGLVEAQWAWARATLQATVSPGADALRQAHDYLLAAAEQGLAGAQHALGDLYLDGLVRPGLVIAADTALALVWYRRAATHGRLQAVVALERLELAGHTRNAARAARRKSGPERRRTPEQWLEVAESGDADSRYHLGLMLENGWALPADSAQAQAWYRKAAEQGLAPAQVALARLLEAAGLFEALDWYRLAAEQGLPEAQFALARNLSSGRLQSADSLAGLVWYLRAAEQGHAAALVTVGSLLGGDMGPIAQQCYQRAAALGAAQAQYQLGEQLQKNSSDPDALQQAQRWFAAAAAQGHAAAQCALGLMYLDGRVVARDLPTAIDWLRQAAEQGEPRAQWNLGSLYVTGNAALPRDVPTALQWCHQAAEQGFAAAQATLGALYARMERWDQARHWLERAAAQDDPEALYNLAQLVLQSKLQGISKEHALTYMNKAAQLGVVAAQARLGLAYASGDGATLDPIEAHKWFLLASGQGDRAAAANLARSETLIAEAAKREALRRAQEWSKSANV